MATLLSSLAILPLLSTSKRPNASQIGLSLGLRYRIRIGPPLSNNFRRNEQSDPLRSEARDSNGLFNVLEVSLILIV